MKPSKCSRIKNMSEEVNKTFGSRVREIRTRLGLTQGDFGRGLGISIQHLSDIESDKKKPCHDFFYHMAKEYRINLNYLLLGEGAMFVGDKELIPPERKDRDFGEANERVHELIDYLERSPMVKFDMLGYFTRYLIQNRSLVEEDIKNNEKSR